MTTESKSKVMFYVAFLVGAWALPVAAETSDDAEKEASTVIDTNAEAEANPEDAGEAEAVPENTIELCSDGVDNDKDSHVDCDDQDCDIYAICVQKTEASATEEEASSKVTRVTVFETQPRKEVGRYCSDGVDNDKNGLMDCHEDQCKNSRYCKRVMYHYTKDDTRPPGLFVNFGLGLALPNYREPRATTDSDYGRNVSFEPDFGGMLDLQVGFMFLKYVGAGVNFKSAITAGSNRQDHFFNDDDDDDYKFIGLKYWGNVGGFVRLQWPFERVVPYLNIHAGFSSARHRWHIYDDANSWDDVYDYESDDDDDIVGDRDTRKSGAMRHFTFAFEPGVDVFVVQRLFGVGVKAWLPVVASSDSETDNVGLMVSFIFTPQWRGKKQLKDEYKNTPAPAPSPTPSNTTGI